MVNSSILLPRKYQTFLPPFFAPVIGRIKQCLAIANKPTPFSQEGDSGFPSPRIGLIAPNDQIRLLAVILFDIHQVYVELFFLRHAGDAKDTVPHLGEGGYVNPGVVGHGPLQRGGLKAQRHGGVVQPGRAMKSERRECVFGTK